MIHTIGLQLPVVERNRHDIVINNNRSTKTRKQQGKINTNIGKKHRRPSFSLFVLLAVSSSLILDGNCFSSSSAKVKRSTRTGTLRATFDKKEKKSSTQTCLPMTTKGNNNSHDTANRLILVVGSANQDLVSNTHIMPRIGETVMGNKFETTCGGKGANQAVAAASLCLAPVSIVCRVGDDLFGQNLLSNFDRVGVQYDIESTILKDNTPSGVASIVVDRTSGDNLIIVSPGANYKLTKQHVRETIVKLKPSIVLVQLEIRPEVALEALKVGADVGAITILNTAPAPEGWSLDDYGIDFYQSTDILIPNESELRKLAMSTAGNIGDATEEEEVKMAESLLNKGIQKAVIVTLGDRGALVVEKTKTACSEETQPRNEDNENVNVTMVDAPDELPARKLPVASTVGAGDAFCGALCAYLSTGLGLTLPEAATFACGVASTTVRKAGAQESYPTYEELPSCLKLESKYKEFDSKRQKVSSKPVITFVTGNKKKLQEVKQILNQGCDALGFELANRKIDLPELQGDPFEIAKEKCRLASKTVNGPVLTEDTSLCFVALNGMPGPYIKWFLDNCGHKGLNQMLDGFDDRSAYAQTIVAYCSGPCQDVEVFEGRTNGKIVQPRGSLDFGWDPIFEPNEGEGKTYAEMSKDFKNSISHRGRSFSKARKYLLDHFNKEEA